MRSVYLLLILLTAHSISNARQPDLCRYFTISVVQKEIRGELLHIASPAVNDSQKDDFGLEAALHHSRYEYLLRRYFQNDSAVVALFPDTAKINAFFCTQINIHAGFRENFSLVCPPSFLQGKTKNVCFSTTEMMFIASRFFYCNKVNKDTAIIPKICVGINGIKEMESRRDLAALEAFVYEAVFTALQGKDEPAFLTDFTSVIQKSMKERRETMKSPDDFLLQVRHDCFRDMEQNENLKKSLLAYYYQNISNISFSIQ